MQRSCLFAAAWCWLAASVPAGAQGARIVSLTHDRTLTWTQGVDNASAAILVATNPAAGPWLPAQHLIPTGVVTTTTLPQPHPAVAFYRIQTADLSRVPAGMVLVPGGSFQMGDSYEQGFVNARPAHIVHVSEFFLSRYEVTNEEMLQVLQWAYARGWVNGDATTITNTEGDPRELLDLDGDDHGHPFTHISFSNGVFSVAAGRENFPATGVTWYGAQAYCNYRSDMEGLPRCITFTNRISAYLSDWLCDFNQPGYRLPTEAEWEKAARGGMTEHHYPWDGYGSNYRDHIDYSKANYGAADTKPVGYYDGNQVVPGFTNVSDMANGYGLYDMAGNVWEWVWDYYKADWYSLPEATQDDTRGPRGPLLGTEWLLSRPIRGGSVGYVDGVYMTCACRHGQGWSPRYANWVVGFRCARSVEPQETSAPRLAGDE